MSRRPGFGEEGWGRLAAVVLVGELIGAALIWTAHRLLAAAATHDIHVELGDVDDPSVIPSITAP